MQEVGDLELTETESEFNSNTRPQTALRSAQTGARFRVALRFFRRYGSPSEFSTLRTLCRSVGHSLESRLYGTLVGCRL